MSAYTTICATVLQRVLVVPRTVEVPRPEGLRVREEGLDVRPDGLVAAVGDASVADALVGVGRAVAVVRQSAPTAVGDLEPNLVAADPAGGGACRAVAARDRVRGSPGVSAPHGTSGVGGSGQDGGECNSGAARQWCCRRRRGKSGPAEGGRLGEWRARAQISHFASRRRQLTTS